MARILFYSPFNHRSRDTETLMIAFQRQGHTLISLSQAEGLYIHDALREHGIETYSYVIKNKHQGLYYLKHIIYLIRFCRKQKIDIIYSHLEPANFVAVLSQFLIKARVYICRHHITEAALRGFDRSVFYKLTYRLARKIIVVSQAAQEYMISHEKINAQKIIHINLGYDFSLYEKPNEDVVSMIRKQVAAELILITAGRLMKYKRTEQSILLLKRLVETGVNAKLIILGDGEDAPKLKALAEDEKLTERVIMPGYVNAIINYLYASDFLLHPSVSESSCVIVKEAALSNLPVIVCNGVGDFDSYIENGLNGFLTAPANFVEEGFEVIKAHIADRDGLRRLSNNLREKIFELFSVENVISRYEHLNRLD